MFPAPLPGADRRESAELKGSMHSSPRLTLDGLKRCPLCEAVVAEATDACFVCGWAGAFERDADDVRASVDALVARCPELADLRPKRRPLARWKARLFRALGR